MQSFNYNRPNRKIGRRVTEIWQSLSRHKGRRAALLVRVALAAVLAALLSRPVRLAASGVVFTAGMSAVLVVSLAMASDLAAAGKDVMQAVALVGGSVSLTLVGYMFIRSIL